MENQDHSDDFNWSDEKCRSKSMLDHFPSAARNVDVQKEIIIRFLDFYFGGKVKTGLSACDLIFAVIAIMPKGICTGPFLWPEHHFKDSGTLFFLTPEDKLRMEIKSLNLPSEIKKDETSENNKLPEINLPSEIKKDETSENIKLTEINDGIECSKPGPSSHNLNNEHETLLGDSDESDRPNTDETETEMTSTSNEKEIPGTKKSGFESKNDKSEDQKREDLDGLSAGINFGNVVNKKTARTHIVLEYDPLTNSAFNKKCNELLEKWSINADARMTLKSLFGFIALTLMRSATKTPNHLVKAFSTENFLQSLRDIAQYRDVFSVPNKKCIRSAHRAICKKNYNTQIMFAKIVILALDNETVYLGKLMKTTVLNHTSNYGLGIWRTLYTIGTHYDEYEMHQLYTLTFQTGDCAIKESWVKLHKFIEKYVNSNTHTYRWARIIDGNDNFKSLSCHSNYAFALILAVFVEKLTKSPGVWTSPWVTAVDEDEFNKYKSLGGEIIKKVAMTSFRIGPLRMLELCFGTILSDSDIY